MKSFDEWRNEQRNKVDGYTERDAYEAGQQSKQAEVDELQKRIDDALSEIESGITGKHHVKSIIKILKGDSHES